MKNEALVSIIIPVYNVSKYMDMCLESVMGQTYTNLEIILVDDGSTDDSGKKCDSYAENDSRIQVIHKNNGGASSARNQGVKVSKGKYIAFVDADDYIYPNYVETLYRLIDDNSADISICTCYKLDEKEKTPDISRKEEKIIGVEYFTGEEAIENLLYRKGITAYPVAKLFCASLIKDKKFLENVVYGEDLIFVYNTLACASKVVLLRKDLYIYYQRSSSVNHQKINVKNYQISWEAYVNNVYDSVKKERESLLAPLQSKTLIYSLDFYSRLIGINEAKDLCKDLKKYIRKCRFGVLKDRYSKIINRCLALLCCISITMTGYLCQFFVRAKGLLHIEVRKPL